MLNNFIYYYFIKKRKIRSIKKMIEFNDSFGWCYTYPRFLTKKFQIFFKNSEKSFQTSKITKFILYLYN